MNDRFPLMRSVTAFLFLGLGTGCGPSNRSLPPGSGRLTADVVAKVGGDTIALATAQRIADRQKLSATEALGRAVSDALFSQQAKQDLAQSALPHYFERLALARVLLNDIEREARDLGIASDAELAEIVGERWWDFQRPELFRTTHAAVQIKKDEDAPSALALAQKIHDVVRGITDPKEFRARVEAMNPGALKVQVDDLPPISSDGRSADPDAPPAPGASTPSFDPAFARAAASLGTVGQLSPVVRSSFGYHVILLTQIFPAKNVPLDEQRRVLQGEVIDRRARRRYQQLLDELRAKTPVAVADQAAALTESLQARP